MNAKVHLNLPATNSSKMSVIIIHKKFFQNFLIQYLECVLYMSMYYTTVHIIHK